MDTYVLRPAMTACDENEPMRLAEKRSSILERGPLITGIVSTLALTAFSIAGLGDQLAFDRTTIVAGEFWRLLTGHLTHWNGDHLTWDLLMFAVLGAMIERRSRWSLIAIVLAAAGSISAAVWLAQPQITQYRGLSGVDSALFTYVVAMLLTDARRSKQSLATAGILAVVAGFVGKLVWELSTGTTLFVDSAAANFTPLPLAHVVGGAVGLLTWFAARWTSIRARTS